jgi:hypothetical protein
MAAPQTTAERLLYTTTKVTTILNDQPHGSGTAFFYNVRTDDGEFINLLVTNKHVVSGSDAIYIVFHRLAPDSNPPAPSGELLSWKINYSQQAFFNHPDPDVDLCALVISDVSNQTAQVGTPIFFIGLDNAIIPSEDDWVNFDAIENVQMIGCPRGIHDEVNNIPITRRGTTATPLGNHYNGKQEFVVDMACFPGSSGSPIILNNRDGYLDRKGNAFMMGGERLFLVGVLYAGPMITNDGTIILNHMPRVEVATMMHLGFALRSTRLLDIENLILARWREQSGQV